MQIFREARFQLQRFAFGWERSGSDLEISLSIFLFSTSLPKDNDTSLYLIQPVMEEICPVFQNRDVNPESQSRNISLKPHRVEPSTTSNITNPTNPRQT
jgi:hypothetical protein